MSLVISLKGVDLAKDHLVRFKASMADMTGTMEKLGVLMAKYFSGEAFVSQGQVYDKPWDALAESTVAEKSKNWPGRPPLVRTGDLQNGFGYTITPLSVTVRNKVEVTSKSGTYNLLQLQQEGTSRGIPPRMVMALNEHLKTEVSAVVKEDVLAKIEETRV